MRPSEQGALKWSAVDNEFIHIELSRVKKIEKTELKTPESIRRIDLRPSMQKVLEAQKNLMRKFSTLYIFLNMQGNPIDQDALTSSMDERHEEKQAASPPNV